MLIKKSQAKEFTIPGKTDGIIYPSSPNKDQTIARVAIDGNYPEKGWSLNDIATETIYLLTGSIEIDTEDKWEKIEEGDLFMVFPGNKYKIRGKGDCLVFITPAWEENNNQIIQ
ncbi:MAG: hypothetical protein R6V40_00620 [Candidatus Moraniibacteriota bacterium]